MIIRPGRTGRPKAIIRQHRESTRPPGVPEVTQRVTRIMYASPPHVMPIEISVPRLRASGVTLPLPHFSTRPSKLVQEQFTESSLTEPTKLLQKSTYHYNIVLVAI